MIEKISRRECENVYLIDKINELIEYINAREKKEENRVTQQQTNTGWYEIL